MLIVANHISYLDILLLGSLVDASFVAKSEISHWPLIGFLAKLSGTVFVERKARSSGQQRDIIRSELEAGKSLVLFAEGTSSDGLDVLPFKSSLFGAFEANDLAKHVTIKPVTIHYARLASGEPLAGEDRQRYAWYGDMTLLPHLWSMLGLSGVTVRVSWHEAISSDAWNDRKDLAKQLQNMIADGLRKGHLEDGLESSQFIETASGEPCEATKGGSPGLVLPR